MGPSTTVFLPGGTVVNVIHKPLTFARKTENRKENEEGEAKSVVQEIRRQHIVALNGFRDKRLNDSSKEKMHLKAHVCF